MNRTSRIYPLIAIIFGVAVAILSFRKIQEINLKRCCIAQMEHLSKLTLLIAEFRQLHGKNPETINSLLEFLGLESTQIAALQFQQSPTSPPRDWLYFPNGTPQGWILYSPAPIKYIGDSSERYLVSYPDGARELVSPSKWKLPPPSSRH